MGRNRIKIDLLIHDLKVPLSVIEAGLVSMLTREEKYGPLTDKQKKVLKRVLRNTRRTITLVNDALELVRLRLGMEEIPAPLRERILHGEERVNPFFTEELINSLIDRGYLVQESASAPYHLVGDLSQVEVPDSVQALVMSRIDRLDERCKLTVKVASVIGKVFRYRPLHWIYPVEIAAERLQHNLNKLNRLNMTIAESQEPDLTYTFKNITIQEVAYESLLYAYRRPVFVVDAYTRRILMRHGFFAEPPDYGAMQAFFERHLTPDVDLYNDFHAQIVWTGKHHCRAQPRCASCPLAPLLPNGPAGRPD